MKKPERTVERGQLASAAYAVLLVLLGVDVISVAESQNAPRGADEPPVELPGGGVRNEGPINRIASPPRAAVVELDLWTYDADNSAWTAREIIGADVMDAQGERIGTARNLLLDERGVAIALVVATSGLGRGYLAVPMDEVRIGTAGVSVALIDEAVPEYALFRDDYFSQADIGSVTQVEGDLETGPRLWKATSLLDDYAVIETGEPVGYVADLAFDSTWRLLAVLVDTANAELAEPGSYAYPWYDVGFEPGLEYYPLPYDREEIAGLAMVERKRD